MFYGFEIPGDEDSETGAGAATCEGSQGMKILFRSSLAEENEEAIARKHFTVVDSRSLVEPGDLVIGRYSVLPYYDELEKDVGLRGGQLINTHRMHRYIADIANWYPDLEGLTPHTWFRLEDVPKDEPGSFVLKGETNSRKSLWKTHMFAPTRADIMTVYLRLLDDSLLGSQRIYVRRYELMKQFEGVDSVQGLPVTNEWRYFICDWQVMARGFYWSEHEDIVNPSPDLAPPASFVSDVIDRIGQNARFYVVDFGQKADGSWMVVELNDGQQSGVSCVDPNKLYANLRRVLEKGPEVPSKNSVYP